MKHLAQGLKCSGYSIHILSSFFLPFFLSSFLSFSFFPLKQNLKTLVDPPPDLSLLLILQLYSYGCFSQDPLKFHCVLHKWFCTLGHQLSERDSLISVSPPHQTHSLECTVWFQTE